MRAKWMLLTGVAALVIGVIGLLIVASAVTAPSVREGWGYGSSGMMGMMGGPVAADASPIGIEQASTAARNYIARFGTQNLELGEVMEFGANYYAQAVERDTGVHAFEILVDKYTGAVFPEMGPNMVWNTKYGMMGGMMGWRRSGQPMDMTVGPERAQELARQYLKTQGLQLDVAEPDRFYGYYTLHTVRGAAGDVEGMLSVNGYSGEVWYHVWHGPFIQMQEAKAGTGGGLYDRGQWLHLHHRLAQRLNPK